MLRADSGFAREALMSWCEANGVDFLFGLAKNKRLVTEITADKPWTIESVADGRDGLFAKTEPGVPPFMFSFEG